MSVTDSAAQLWPDYARLGPKPTIRLDLVLAA